MDEGSFSIPGIVTSSSEMTDEDELGEEDDEIFWIDCCLVFKFCNVFGDANDCSDDDIIDKGLIGILLACLTFNNPVC